MGIEDRAAPKREIPAVVDPVIVASSGGRFLDWAGVEALHCELVPCGVVLTPNLMEAADLTGASLCRFVAAPDTRITAARSLIAMGAVGVVIKGGARGGASGPRPRDGCRRRRAMARARTDPGDDPRLGVPVRDAPRGGGGARVVARGGLEGRGGYVAAGIARAGEAAARPSVSISGSRP
jgi:hydroxymethylpyrimidine/phosphomethylpyrimidine kinase